MPASVTTDKERLISTLQNQAAPGQRSRAAFDRALGVLVGGTTRVTIERDPIPRYMERGDGAYLYDVDGRRFLDLNNNFTAIIHGHNFAPVVEAVTRQLSSGTCFANPTLGEIDLAELICARVPGVDRLRFVNTGTEAVMFAIKAARAYTGRPAIAKIEGAYHGSYDWVEVSQASTPDSWGSLEQPAAVAAYKGQPDAVLADVIPLRLNQPELAEQLIEANASRLAAIVLDPMPGRAGFIPPTPEFVSTIQAVAKKHGILIIGDEVLNFRQGFTGACARHGISPDLFTFGKIIGGGLPIGAIGGREDVMRVFDGSMGKPLVSQGGTFSANPLSMVAGFASMQALNHSAFAHLEELGDRLRGQLRASIERHNAPFSITGVASLFQIHAKATAPREFREAATSAAETNVMLEVTRNFANFGIIIPNRVTACLSTPMTQADIDLVAGAFEHFLVARSDLVDTLSQ